MNNQQVCQHFLRGHCRFGANCRFIHPADIQPNPQPNPAPPAVVERSNICRFFMQGNCTNPQCRYIHGYSEALWTSGTANIHQSEILDIAILDQNSFITCDENEVKVVKLIPQFEQPNSMRVENGEKICKMITSNGKIIFATVLPAMYGIFKYYETIFKSNKIIFSFLIFL